MRHELHQLLARVDQTRGARRLASLITAATAPVLRADAVGFYLYPDPSHPGVAEVVGLPAAFSDRYERVGRRVDPVLAEVTESHAAVSSDDLLTPRGWRTCPLYVQVSRHFGLEHIVTAPLIGATGVIGTVNAARRGAEDQFLRGDLAAISAVAAHASIAMTHRDEPDPAGLGLTPRECQIVDLVVRGWTNASVGRRLGISENTVKQALKTVFQKTGVRSRAQLATLVATGPNRRVR